MKIIITGCAGFIGYHLSNRLLNNKKNKIVGFDSLNRYYSIKLKEKRLSFLKKNKNFFFYKLNIARSNNLEKIIKDFNPDIIFHLGGQPGVLYSFKNPKSYELNNFVATKKLCKIVKKFKIKKFVFASSSSVYGDQKKYPISENAKLFPKNPYARSKLNCEKHIKKVFSRKNIDYIIFRFFTVYGPFGRPDMFIHKFLNNIFQNKKINIYNLGNNLRDFTFIDDVNEILTKCIKNQLNGKILNICRSKPIKTNDLINLFKKNINPKKFNLNYIGAVKGEMLKTHGSNTNLKKVFYKKKFVNLEKGLRTTIDNFKKYRF